MTFTKYIKKCKDIKITFYDWKKSIVFSIEIRSLICENSYMKKSYKHIRKVIFKTCEKIKIVSKTCEK